MAKHIPTSNAVLEALREAGLADDNTRRVVIDIQAGYAPVVYIEKFGDESLIKVAQAVAGVEVTRA
jgi:hypothetical protein